MDKNEQKGEKWKCFGVTSGNFFSKITLQMIHFGQSCTDMPSGDPE